MSGTINDVTVTTWPATIADIKNGDDANEGTFSPPITDLAKRTRFAHDELTVRGVRRIKDYVSAASAKAAAIGTVSTGDTARIAGLGIFFYNSDTAGDTELAPIRYLVTGTAGGIWRNIAFGFQSLNTANGLAPLDAASKVPQANLRGQLVAAYPAPDSSTATGGTTGNGALVEITGPGGSSGQYIEVPNLVVGDVLVFGATYLPTLNANTFLELSYRLRKTDASSVSFAQQVAAGFVYVPTGYPAATPAALTVSGMYKIQSGDLSISTTLRVHMNQKSTTGSTAANGISAVNVTNSSGILHYRGP